MFKLLNVNFTGENSVKRTGVTSVMAASEKRETYSFERYAKCKKASINL